MKKKAFTLIELLAVIVLLGILLLIAVPAITRYLSKGSKTYYNNLEEVLKIAGRDYTGDYEALLPREIGNVTILSLNELVSNKYLDNVVDDKGDSCEAKVAVKKTGKKSYEYYSCLVCDNYHTEGDNCNYTENDNVTSETKNYSIEVEKELYRLKQGESLTLPYAKAYYMGELVNSIVTGYPSVIDTNIAGTTIVTYAFKGAKKKVTVEVIDDVAPTIPVVTLKYENATGGTYNGKWYGGNLYVKFESTDYTKPGLMGSGIDHYELSKDGINWTNVSSTYTLTESGDIKYYIRGVDKSGNKSEISDFDVKIDNKIPTCDITTTGDIGDNDWYISNVTAELDIHEIKSGLLISNIDKTSVTTNTTGTEIKGLITSVSGNIGSCIKTVKIDKQTPGVPTMTANDGIKSDGWHKANFNINVTGGNNISGNYQKYGTTTDPTIVGSVITNPDEKTYYAKTCSNAGLCGTTSNYIVKIDSTIPTCEVVLSGTKGNNDWYIGDVTATLNIPAIKSGLLASSIDNEKITTNTLGKVVIGTVTSVSGKIGTCTTTVKLDKQVPSAPAIIANDGVKTNNWHKTDFSLEINGGTNISGNYHKYGTSTDPTTTGSTINLNTTHLETTYYAKTCSNAGLCGTTSNYIVKLEKDVPVAPVIQGGSNTWISTNRTINIKTAGSALSNITNYEYYKSTSSTTPTSEVVATGTTSGNLTVSDEGTRYIWYRTVSTVGNKSAWSNVQEVKVDLSNPTASIAVSGKTATLTLTDNIGVVGYKVTTTTAIPTTWDTITSTTSTTKTYTATSATTYYVHVKDVSGRTGYATFTIPTTAFCSYEPGKTWTFNYSSSNQTFTTTCDGIYQIQSYGAAGGSLHHYSRVYFEYNLNTYNEKITNNTVLSGGTLVNAYTTLTESDVITISTGSSPSSNEYYKDWGTVSLNWFKSSYSNWDGVSPRLTDEANIKYTTGGGKTTVSKNNQMFITSGGGSGASTYSYLVAYVYDHGSGQNYGLSSWSQEVSKSNTTYQSGNGTYGGKGYQNGANFYAGSSYINTNIAKNYNSSTGSLLEISMSGTNGANWTGSNISYGSNSGNGKVVITYIKKQ